MPSDVMLSVFMLNVTYKPCKLSVFMLIVFMLSVFMLNVIMLNVIMLSVFMLNVIMLNVVMLSVVAPCTVLHSLETLRAYHKISDKAKNISLVTKFFEKLLNKLECLASESSFYLSVAKKQEPIV
jgi:hypothetical protein